MSALQDFVRLVFERGVELSRSDQGVWCFTSAESRLTGTAASVLSDYALRPVLGVLNTRSDPVLFPAHAARLLDIEHSDLYQRFPHLKHGTSLVHSFNVYHVLGAVLYHCKHLAEEYSRVCRAFAKWPSHEGKYDRVVFGGQSEPYYEFEALATAVVRFYDATRFILWNAFGAGSGGVPRSFERALRSCTCLPEGLASRLTESWSKFGVKTKAYRDCLVHYVPVGDLIPMAWMIRLEGGLWSVSCRIPDNPEVRSQRQFTYAEELDALTYAWELTTEVFEVARAVVGAVEGNGQ